MSFRDFIYSELLEAKKDRGQIAENSRKLQTRHTSTSKEHIATANSLIQSINALTQAARSTQSEKQMASLAERAKKQHKELNPIIEAHIEAARAHRKAATEHGHVVTIYNGHPDAYKDAMQLTKIAEEKTEHATSL